MATVINDEEHYGASQVRPLDAVVSRLPGCGKQYQRISTPSGTVDEPLYTAAKSLPMWRSCLRYALLGLFMLALLIITETAGRHPSWTTSSTTAVGETSSSETTAQPAANHTMSCHQRQEWRTLTRPQQQAYINAVLCLRDQPSHWSANKDRTAYDDFPWVHSHEGYFTHNSAPFLPWHRYFLHIYETTLREKCGYDGGLIYWDWTIDSDALEKSPVFDPDTGFGGDGEVGGAATVGRTGRCVADGPFANLNVSYYDVKLQPHCLSRGFRDQDGNLGHIDGLDISPASIEEVLNIDSYEDFVALMESRVHDAIPFGIGGDFETFTAPYDPIFFLHHTQLDRLWWMWQQRGNGSRVSAYGGHKQRHSIEMASLDDEIKMRGLAPLVKVAEVVDTQGSLLCYRY